MCRICPNQSHTSDFSRTWKYLTETFLSMPMLKDSCRLCVGVSASMNPLFPAAGPAGRSSPSSDVSGIASQASQPGSPKRFAQAWCGGGGAGRGAGLGTEGQKPVMSVGVSLTAQALAYTLTTLHHFEKSTGQECKSQYAYNQFVDAATACPSAETSHCSPFDKLFWCILCNFII